MATTEYLRDPNDAFDTHPALALACAQWCEKFVLGPKSYRLDASDTEPRRVLNILDPTAGTGPYVRAAREVWPDSKIAAFDIREATEIPQLATAGANFVRCSTDILSVPAANFGKVDLVLTNLPFKHADAIIRHVWSGLRDGASIAVLLNITFLAAQERWDGDDALYNIAPLRFCAPIVPRPSFLTIDGKDCSGKFEAGFFVWTKGWSPEVATGYTENDIVTSIPEPLRWEKPKKPRAPRGSKKQAPALDPGDEP